MRGLEEREKKGEGGVEQQLGQRWRERENERVRVKGNEWKSWKLII